MNSAFVVAVFEPEGHEITLAKTGPDGLAAGLRGPFDLILMDIELPGLNGDEVCRALHDAGVRTPIVALTASAMPDQIAIFQAAGFDDVVTKPVEPQELRAMARRFEPDSTEARFPSKLSG
jgi:CheY-like chemotaxis protein